MLAKRRREIWELCKQITRKRYVREDGSWECYTCGSIIDEPKKAQTGHCINSDFGGLILRYDLRNLRIQDYYCNINLGSNGAVYLQNLINEIGQREVDELFVLLGYKDNKFTHQEEIDYLEKLIDEYKKY